MHNKLFLNTYFDDIKIINIRNEIIDFTNNDTFCMKYINNINKFLKKNKIDINANRNDDIFKYVVTEYWQNLLNIFKHIKNNSHWSYETMNDYLICATRIEELLIFLCHVNDNYLNEIFFKEIDYSIDCYYFYLQNIGKEVSEANFDIVKLNKINRVSLKEDNFYLSSLNIQPFKGEQFTKLEYFFKLKDHYVEEIYSLSASNNIIEGRNPQGQFGERIAFEVIDDINIEKIIYEKNEKNLKDISDETKKESYLKRRKIQSPLLDKNVANLINEEFYDLIQNNDISSKYKRFKISKAISNSITRENLKLESNYKFPELESIKDFFINKNSNSIYKKVLLLSFLMGFELKKLLLILLKLDRQVIFSVKKSILKIKINKKIFAAEILDNYVAQDIKKQECELHLSENLIKLWQEIEREIELIFRNKYTDKQYVLNLAEKYEINFDKEELKPLFVSEESSFIKIIEDLKQKIPKEVLKKLESINIANNLIDDFEKETKEYLKKELKKNNKTLNLSLSAISKLSLHYYKIFNKRSDLHLLYSRSISTNDEARLCYCAIRDRLYNFEEWISSLYELIFSKNEEIISEIETNKWVGSPFYIKNGYYKQFIFELTKIKSNDDIINFNLNMIFIRYSLSLLIATRDYTTSCNLAEYSKKFKILTIQEKAKNVYHSKRLIPLTDRAIRIIDNFYLLKEEFKITSFVPCLVTVEGKEEILNEKNILKFFDSLDQELYKDTIYFLKSGIKNIKLNFGRHVTTSFLSSTDLNAEYLDAFLNHFKMGTEDQGIYSNFNNQDYQKQIIKKIEIIEENYLPKFVRIGKYEY